MFVAGLTKQVVAAIRWHRIDRLFLVCHASAGGGWNGTGKPAPTAGRQRRRHVRLMRRFRAVHNARTFSYQPAPAPGATREAALDQAQLDHCGAASLRARQVGFS